jgi:hypothetical protein
MPSLCDVAHEGDLCTFSYRSDTDRGKWWGLEGQAAWTVHHVQNHTLLGHSPPACQALRLVGPTTWPSASLLGTTRCAEKSRFTVIHVGTRTFKLYLFN